MATTTNQAEKEVQQLKDRLSQLEAEHKNKMTQYQQTKQQMMADFIAECQRTYPNIYVVRAGYLYRDSVKRGNKYDYCFCSSLPLAEKIAAELTAEYNGDFRDRRRVKIEVRPSKTLKDADWLRLDQTYHDPSGYWSD